MKSSPIRVCCSSLHLEGIAKEWTTFPRTTGIRPATTPPRTLLLSSGAAPRATSSRPFPRARLNQESTSPHLINGLRSITPTWGFPFLIKKCVNGLFHISELFWFFFFWTLPVCAFANFLEHCFLMYCITF